MSRLIEGAGPKPRLPRLAILGYGRAGKDEAGRWLGEHTDLRYAGSTSQVVCPLIAKDLGISEQEAWDTRHQNRIYWKDWCNNYGADDPAKLARYCLYRGDIVVGLRDKVELAAIKAEGLIDLYIWIDHNVPVDPTVTFTVDDCDIVIRNHGTPGQLHEKLGRLAIAMGLDVRSD